ncbi:MAG TPA: hypothetical protein VFQ61_38830 [Polyangiaceae bacterium]|nr:hypothetical protein [Polyangiaceae bacterium]
MQTSSIKSKVVGRAQTLVEQFALRRRSTASIGVVTALLVAASCSTGANDARPGSGDPTASAAESWTGAVSTSCTSGAPQPGQSYFTARLKSTRGRELSLAVLTPKLGDTGVPLSVQLDGKALYEMESHTTQDGVESVQKYHAPLTGIQRVVTIANENSFFANFDGRETVPANLGTEPQALRFKDGLPPPTVGGDQALIAAMSQLFDSAGRESSACLAASESNLEANTDSLGSLKNELTTGHRYPVASGVSGSACNGCEYGCKGKYLGCIGAASVLGPFGAAFGALACIGVFERCNSECHKSGTDCCPVGCGGESGILNPIGACCLAGETCVRRATDDHVALCCEAGTTLCNGVGCCQPGDTCLPSGQCCPEMRNGECCSIGTCTTRADCNGGDPNGSNGCSDNGCCVPG